MNMHEMTYREKLFQVVMGGDLLDILHMLPS